MDLKLTFKVKMVVTGKGEEDGTYDLKIVADNKDQVEKWIKDQDVNLDDCVIKEVRPDDKEPDVTLPEKGKEVPIMEKYQKVGYDYIASVKVGGSAIFAKSEHCTYLARIYGVQGSICIDAVSFKDGEFAEKMTIVPTDTVAIEWDQDHVKHPEG